MPLWGTEASTMETLLKKTERLYMCAHAGSGWMQSRHWKCHYFMSRIYMCTSNGVCTCLVCSSLWARLRSLKCTVDVRASACTSRGLIDCVPGQEELKKKLCPECSIWSIDVGECGQVGERRRRKEGDRARSHSPPPSFFFWLLCLCH